MIKVLFLGLKRLNQLFSPFESSINSQNKSYEFNEYQFSRFFLTIGQILAPPRIGHLDHLHGEKTPSVFFSIKFYKILHDSGTTGVPIIRKFNQFTTLIYKN